MVFEVSDGKDKSRSMEESFSEQLTTYTLYNLPQNVAI